MSLETKLDQILERLEIVSLTEQYKSVSASVEESFDDNKINLKFIIDEGEQIFVQRINIFGNNITIEDVIRNELIIDEGDPLNKILFNKSINETTSID